MEDEKKESDSSKQQKSWDKAYTNRDGEMILTTRPKVINDPNCKHFYVKQETDAEGKTNAGCKKCPMGRRFDPDKFEVRDGEILEIKKYKRKKVK